MSDSRNKSASPARPPSSLGVTGAAYSEFSALMMPALIEASRLARSLEGRVHNNPKLEEATAVKQALTEADEATQEVILQALLEHFPNVSLAAEEDTVSVARFPETSNAQVIIDPIDGTLHSYLEASGPYAVIVGLVVGGRYDAGLIGLPREGLCFEATRGRGARIHRPGRTPQAARVSVEGNRVLVAHNTPVGVTSWLAARGYEAIPACGGAVSVAPLIPGVRAGLRWAPGEKGISIRGRVGALVALEAGAKVCGIDSEFFPDDPDTPASALLVGSDDDDIALLRGAFEAGDFDRM